MVRRVRETTEQRRALAARGLGCAVLEVRCVATLVVLLVAAIPTAWGQAGRLPARVSDRAQLLDGVRKIASPGLPGSVAVFAKTSSAVVTGTSDAGSEVAVVACGRLGQGRIVVLGHDGYFAGDAYKLADTGKFLINAMRWAAGNQLQPRVGLIDGHPLQALCEQNGVPAARTAVTQDIAAFDVLVVTPFRLSAAEMAPIRLFVASGGGLLAAATGWGWQQGSKQPMVEFPGNLLLQGSGLGWTDGFARPADRDPSGYGITKGVSPFVNAAIALGLVGSGRAAGPKDYASALESIRLTLEVIPSELPGVRSEVRKVLKGFSSLDLVPSRQNPVKADALPRRFAVGLETVLAHASPITEVRALAAAKNFPGSVPDRAPRGERTIAIAAGVPGWQSLGLYAVPGDKISVTVPNSASALNAALQIGCHTDQLWHLDSWERLPQVVRRFPITEPRATAASGLGGLIYVDVPAGAAPSRFPIKVRNAVEAPLYRLGVTTQQDWRNKIRHRPAPWAELAGKNIIFTVPSSSVRDLDDPKGVLRLWDEIVAAQDSFVSRPRRENPERIVADVQISGGYMHSGYPIMIPVDGSIDVALSEEKLRREGSWGIIHELGHNHQNDDWTFDGTREVTNNLIVLYVYDKVLGLGYDSGHEAIRDRGKRNQRFREFISKGSPFEEWKKDPFLALIMYIQLYEAFGPEPYMRVFAEYARLPAAERPKSDDDKRDQWLIRMSMATGKNLAPFFQAWGIATSKRARDWVAGLPKWIPGGI